MRNEEIIKRMNEVIKEENEDGKMMSKQKEKPKFMWLLWYRSAGYLCFRLLQ